MKKITIIFLSFIALTSYAQESGHYVKASDDFDYDFIVEDGLVTMTGWKYKNTFHKNSEGKYVSEKGSVLEAGKDRSIVITWDSKVETYNLYAPLEYTLPEGIKEHIVDGRVFFYTTDRSEPHVIGEYIYEEKGNFNALLREDGSGYFRHPQQGAIKEWGFETNYKGEIRRFVGITGAYKLILAVRHTDGTDRRMQVIIQPQERKTTWFTSWVYYW